MNLFLGTILFINASIGVAKADAILLTSKLSKQVGHTSILVQDEKGCWHYYFWGSKVAYEKEVPSDYMQNIDTFNEWLYKEKRTNAKPSKTYSFFTRATTIKGNFSKAKEYYSEQIKRHSTLKYFLGFNFCSVVSRNALNKGILKNGQLFQKLIKAGKQFVDYIPFYDDFPKNYHDLVDRSVKGTEHEGDPNWGIITNPIILDKIKKGLVGSRS